MQMATAAGKGNIVRTGGLELAEEKTGIVVFLRFKKHLGTKFSFLGFDFRWIASRKGKDYILIETNPKRMTKSLKALTKWCKENRNNRIRKIVATSTIMESEEKAASMFEEPGASTVTAKADVVPYVYG